MLVWHCEKVAKGKTFCGFFACITPILARASGWVLAGRDKGTMQCISLRDRNANGNEQPITSVTGRNATTVQRNASTQPTLNTRRMTNTINSITGTGSPCGSMNENEPGVCQTILQL